MSAYFIAATGTDIGKTFTTCAFIHAARALGKIVQAFKPIISGYDANAPQTDADVGQLLDALGQPCDSTHIDRLSPWRFAAPLSPHLAAARENRHIDVAELIDWTKRAATNEADLTLIETVGGLMVPLTQEITTREWMAACNLPLILVTGSYLGSISHTLTALETAHHAGLTIAALIISESCDSTVSLADTRDSIAAFATDIPLIIAQPRVSSYQEATVIHALGDQIA